MSRKRNVRVRPATRQDIPAIVRVLNSSVEEGEDVGFRATGESPFSDAARMAAAWEDPNRVRTGMSTRHSIQEWVVEEIFVAEVGGRVVGCVTLEDRGEALELINIDVPRELQRRGIGSQMVRFVEERAQRDGKRAVTLGTSRNAAGVAWKSLPWWLSRGYTVTGEEQNEWTRKIDPGAREIRMRKDLL
jgi:N-acetylglutamate synthase-like GNAT family acetyltransferase